MQVSIGVELNNLQKLLGSFKAMQKDLRIAINDTAKKTESIMAKQVTQTVNVSQKAVKKVLKLTRAKETWLSASVELSKERRLYIRDFKAVQTKKGVTYKISKQQKGKSLIPGAFIVKKFDNQVFIRANGKERGPIKRKRGVSPWGTFIKNRMTKPTEEQARLELLKQVRERIRFRTLKAQGKI